MFRCGCVFLSSCTSAYRGERRSHHGGPSEASKKKTPGQGFLPHGPCQRGAPQGALVDVRWMKTPIESGAGALFTEKLAAAAGTAHRITPKTESNPARSLRPRQTAPWPATRHATTPILALNVGRPPPLQARPIKLHALDLFAPQPPKPSPAAKTSQLTKSQFPTAGPPPQHQDLRHIRQNGL